MNEHLKFCIKLGKTLKETYAMVVYEDQALSVKCGYERFARFRECRRPGTVQGLYIDGTSSNDLTKSPGPDGIFGQMIENPGQLGKQRLVDQSVLEDRASLSSVKSRKKLFCLESSTF
ncbi:hypothetical protein TNCV_1168291 [Trichonephila clavipes]|uniref:Uncharacterized protein n=1 Tax=Trichonephila clavipes TaxID=2585209 RepID=A0A8X6T113_TRICX|nr:hypothetical protein TNCV_1168291 [Trichonephila clavipes]